MKTIRAFAVLAFMVATVSSVHAASTNSGLIIQQALASGRPTLIDFGGTSCHVCMEMKPVLDAARKDYQEKANIIFVDVWEEEDLGKTYKVQLIPTQIFYNSKGIEVKRHMGFMDRKSIDAALKEAGTK